MVVSQGSLNQQSIVCMDAEHKEIETRHRLLVVTYKISCGVKCLVLVGVHKAK